jgi:hypothetical protein
MGEGFPVRLNQGAKGRGEGQGLKQEHIYIRKTYRFHRENCVAYRHRGSYTEAQEHHSPLLPFFRTARYDTQEGFHDASCADTPLET